MSEQLAFSFSDPDAGLHCFGRSGETALLLSSSGANTCGPVEVVRADERFDVTLPNSGEASLEPLGPAVAFPEHGRTAWLCRARGKAADGRAIDGFGCAWLGERGLGGLARRRSVWICFGDSLAVALLAGRTAGKSGHDEPVAGFVARGTPLEASPLAEPLLSSTYRADGQLLRAGLELWEGQDAQERERARALRVGGETVAAGELAQNGIAASVAFLVWHHDGRQGAGAYVSETAAS